ncbi:MAG: hypothetical protein HS113_25600 [Verrucomicrobiales bacterium]|nr:hypothetical protein [Verrucomicrobiales bacterium]
MAARRWGVAPAELTVADGRIREAASSRTLTYATGGATLPGRWQDIPDDIRVTAVAQWRVMGNSAPRVNQRALVTGAHPYPSDYRRPGMLYGKVLRPPSYGARLIAVDLAPARAMSGVVAVQADGFVGVAAPTTWRAEQALKAVAETAEWEPSAHPSSREV